MKNCQLAYRAFQVTAFMVNIGENPVQTLIGAIVFERFQVYSSSLRESSPYLRGIHTNGVHEFFVIRLDGNVGLAFSNEIMDGVRYDLRVRRAKNLSFAAWSTTLRPFLTRR